MYKGTRNNYETQKDYETMTLNTSIEKEILEKDSQHIEKRIKIKISRIDNLFLKSIIRETQK
jgi:ribosomal protein L31E